LRIFFALVPKRSVDTVCSRLDEHGEQQMMSAVRALPPRESWSRRVSLRSTDEKEDKKIRQ
jgi:hypothetical protein